MSIHSFRFEVMPVSNVLRVHNIIFSQIGAYAHSMIEFGCPKALTVQFVRRLSTSYQLSEEQRGMLLAIVSRHNG